MSEKTKVTYNGIGFFGLLTILFVALKLTHVIDWSWWFVLGPLWIPFVVVTAIFAVLLGFMARA